MRPIFSQPTEAGPLVTLNHGPYALVVAPQFGARMVSFRHDGRDVLRPTPDAVIAKPVVYGFAGFPLMPYSGPLFGPGFSFAGEDHVLARNVREEPSATHGDSWIAPFRIIDQTDTALTLKMEHEPRPGTFPFRYRGHVRYALGDAGLSIDLRVTSRDHRSMPAGLGIHPYFPKHPGARLRFDCIGVWPPDGPEVVGVGCQPLTEGFDFRDGQDITDVVIDRLFEGWDGRAEVIAADGFRTVIEADGALDKLQVYSAWDYPYVCVEPVSNTNDGFNRMAAGVPSHGIRILDPGRSIEGTVRISVAS
ncbi:MAG TPA: aldose 1-epimerase [Candidatus Binatia bacterium]|nr:aldose 1-epimerase [Candidatus Binatia bacterium]